MTTLNDFCNFTGNFMIKELINDQTKPFITLRQTLELKRIKKIGMKTVQTMAELQNYPHCAWHERNIKALKFKKYDRKTQRHQR